MSDEFTDVSSGSVRNQNGFTVTTFFGGGVTYEQDGKEYRIDSEWMGKENGIILYPTSPSNKDFSGLDQSKADQILKNIIRALEYQGYTIEIV